MNFKVHMGNLGLVLFFTLMLLMFGCATQPPPTTTEPQKSDLSISVLKLSPSPPANLTTGEKFTVTLGYSFSTPKVVRIWATPADMQLKGGYESSRWINAGKGEVSRFIFRNVPSKIENIRIVAKGNKNNLIYENFHKVNYTYVSGQKSTDMKGDGINSFVSNVNFSHQSPATLSVGTTVAVKMDYDLDTKYGIFLWVEPSTTGGERCISWDASDELKGGGSITRKFKIGCPAHVDSLTIRLRNMAGEDIYKEIIPVDLTYK